MTPGCEVAGHIVSEVHVVVGLPFLLEIWGGGGDDCVFILCVRVFWLHV